ncbi:MAG: dihydroneopterin aldolase [Planctomycetes bacterium]|nr:dihydroneopterin aldolase [Planctomycetota bacterium]
MGVLRIVDLEIDCIVGILPHERKIEQQILFSAEIETDFALVSHQDGKVTGGLDYAQYAVYVKNAVRKGRYYLLEELLDELGQSSLKDYNMIQKLTLNVKKPSAISHCETVEAELSFP